MYMMYTCALYIHGNIYLIYDAYDLSEEMTFDINDRTCILIK